MNRFEQLIEYVINDQDEKARELFHDIVVEKSREIYENLMQEEDIDEAKEEDEDKVEEAKDDEDDDKEQVDEAEDEDLDEAMGGDAAKDLIDDVEMEEESDMNMEAEEDDADMDMGDDDDHHADVGGDEELEDRVMDLEDKLEELMAEFEELMGDEGGDDMGDGDDFEMDAGGDAIEMDDTEEMMPEMGMRPMEEGIDLKAAPKPVTSEEGAVQKKSPVAANAGAKGAMAKPVHTGGEMGGSHDSAAYRNSTKDLGAPSTQDAGPKAFKSQAPAPVKTQASGVNTKSPVPGK